MSDHLVPVTEQLQRPVMPDRRQPPASLLKDRQQVSRLARPAAGPAGSRSVYFQTHIKRADARDTPIHPDFRTAPSKRPGEAAAEPARDVKIEAMIDRPHRQLRRPANQGGLIPPVPARLRPGLLA